MPDFSQEAVHEALRFKPKLQWGLTGVSMIGDPCMLEMPGMTDASCGKLEFAEGCSGGSGKASGCCHHTIVCPGCWKYKN